MPLQRLNPPDLHPVPGYSLVTVVDAGRQAHLAGQCPLDPTGALVGGGDLRAQVDQVITNTLGCLRAVGAEPTDVIRTTIWVATTDHQDLVDVWDRLRASPLAEAFTTASTLVGCTVLGFTGQLVELDVTAALP